MKNTILALGLTLSVACVQAQRIYTVETVPDPKSHGRGYVSNPDGILSNAAVEQINVLCDSIERTHGVQLAVVVLSSIGAEVPKNFATQLFNRWKIGAADKDAGLLLLIVMDQRRSEFETGYGVEEFLPDVVCVRLLDDHLKPKFKAGLYDEGVVNVIRAVNEELTDHKVRDYFKATDVPSNQSRAAGGKPWAIYAGIMLAYALFAFMVWTSNEKSRTQWAVQSGKAAKTDENKKSKKLQYKNKPIIAPLPRFWLAVVLIPFPVTITLTMAADAVNTATLLGALVIYGYFSLLFGLIVIRIYRSRAIQKQYGANPYVMYEKLTEDHKNWWIAFILFLPIFLFYFLSYWLKKRSLRRAPRNGPTTGLPMRLLSEADEDKYLSEGQRKEEDLKSVDYDVWVTPGGEEVQILRYPSWWTSYTDCISCGYKTRSKKTTTIVQPTYTSTGIGETVHMCHHCGHTETTRFSIPKLEYSDSSGSSGGGSSSWGGGGSSSWGGGSSGGGGGGSSW
jgi:uncharacterized protein